MKNNKIESLRIEMLKQLKIQNFVDIALCKELLALATHKQDNNSLAIGHIWLAESYLLHKEDKINCSRELKNAKAYLDTKKPNEIVENYYSIQYKLYTALGDTQVAFEYCLKSLTITERLYDNRNLIDEKHSYFTNTVENRVVKYYGNIGINFFNHTIYDKALLYCKKALDILESLDTVNAYMECLLRLNIIMSLIHTDDAKDVMHHILLIEKLPMEPKSLKIYVDYGYVNYYLYKKDKPIIEFYIHELLNDQVEIHTTRSTAIDFYIDILKSIIELKMEKQALLLFDEIERLIKEDEYLSLLKVAKLKIIYANTFNQKKERVYKEYFELYLRNEKLNNALKVKGLESRLKINEIEVENIKAKNQNNILEDIANYDDLTKIFNRRYLEMEYKELLHDNVTRLGLAIIDIDYYKEYNDAYGHLAGDQVLQKLAKCLQDLLQKNMIVCRYGGDEFVVLSWNESVQSLDRYINEVQQALERLNIEHKMSPYLKRVTISVGFGNANVYKKEDVQELFERADQALYSAKKRGRNKVVQIG